MNHKWNHNGIIMMFIPVVFKHLKCMHYFSNEIDTSKLSFARKVEQKISRALGASISGKNKYFFK